MTRLVLFFLAVLAVASGLAWLADKPGTIDIEWQGYRGQLSVFHAVVILTLATAIAVVALAILRQLWTSPAAVGQFLNKRRQQRGLDALSSGMIAVGAGDRSGATRYALQARKSLPNEPLTHLLRAQAAQLTGDKATARRIFEAMLASPDTEPLGLRGLYLEAMRVKEIEPARQFAERAMRLNPKLGWPVEALFDLQCKGGDWSGALDTLAVAKKHGQVDKPVADRRRAVLLTAQAQALEESDAEKALNLATEAHTLAPSLVPAATIAGRILASRGSTPKAAKVLQKTWSRSPHPDLATAYAYARIGDSPRDRVDRVKQLAALTPQSIESPIAVAMTAIEARDFSEARRALAPLAERRLTQRVATLMARVEGEEHGDKGKVREWLARAVNAPRDPAWTADGIVSERWAPVSPVTGTLDAFQWRVPVDDLEAVEGEELTTRLESLVPLGAPVPGVTPSAAMQPEAEVATVKAEMPKNKAVAKTVAVDAEVVEEEPVASAELVRTTAAEKTAADKAPPPRDRPAGAKEARVEIKSPRSETAPGKAEANGPASPAHSSAANDGPKDPKTQTRTTPRPASKPEKPDPRGKHKGAPAASHEIFVAPDDPGPDPEEVEATALDRPYRAS